MKKLIALTLLGAAALTGCAAYEPVAYGHGGEGDRYFPDGRVKLDRDHDGDGIPDNRDARPANPLRY